MYQKEVVFPEGMVYIEGNKYLYNNDEKTDATITFWFDSTVCSVCRFERMVQLGEFFDFCADSISNLKTDIAIIFTPKYSDVDYLCEYMSSHISNYPVFIDVDRKFGESNDFIAKDEACHTFLLDENKRIMLVGSPLYNRKIWDLYKRELQRIDNSAN